MPSAFVGVVLSALLVCCLLALRSKFGYYRFQAAPASPAACCLSWFLPLFCGYLFLQIAVRCCSRYEIHLTNVLGRVLSFLSNNVSVARFLVVHFRVCSLSLFYSRMDLFRHVHVSYWVKSLIAWFPTVESGRDCLRLSCIRLNVVVSYTLHFHSCGFTVYFVYLAFFVTSEFSNYVSNLFIYLNYI